MRAVVWHGNANVRSDSGLYMQTPTSLGTSRSVSSRRSARPRRRSRPATEVLFRRRSARNRRFATTGSHSSKLPTPTKCSYLCGDDNSPFPRRALEGMRLGVCGRLPLLVGRSRHLLGALHVVDVQLSVPASSALGTGWALTRRSLPFGPASWRFSAYVDLVPCRVRACCRWCRRLPPLQLLASSSTGGRRSPFQSPAQTTAL